VKLTDRLFQLLVLLLPIQLSYHFWPDWSLLFGIRIDYFAPTLYLTDILIAVLVAAWIYTSRAHLPLVSKRLRIILYIILRIAILNVIFSVNPWVSLYKWVKVIEMAALGWYVSSNGNLKLLTAPFSIAMLWSSALALAQAFLGRSLGGVFYLLGERLFDSNTSGIALGSIRGIEYLRPYATFPHPNALAGFLLVGIIILLHSKKTLVTWASIAVSSIAFIVAWSEGAFLAFGVYLVMRLVHKLHVQRTSVFVMMLLLTLFSLCTLPFLPAETNIFPREVRERLLLLQSAKQAIYMHPLTGIGLGTSLSLAPRALMQPVHNMYVLVVSEVGLISLGILWFFTRFTKKVVVEPIVSFALVGILITGLFDHYWITLQQPMITLSIIAGLMVSKKIYSHHEDDNTL